MYVFWLLVDFWYRWWITHPMAWWCYVKNTAKMGTPVRLWKIENCMIKKHWFLFAHLAARRWFNGKQNSGEQAAGRRSTTTRSGASRLFSAIISTFERTCSFPVKMQCGTVNLYNYNIYMYIKRSTTTTLVLHLHVLLHVLQKHRNDCLHHVRLSWV